MAEEVIIVEPGDTRAQKIARAISSQTAGEILSLLREETYTSTELSHHLNLPLTTVQYHLENLIDAGLVSVVEKRWSRKGRVIKVYGLRNQLLIVAPRTGDVRSLLLKYGSLFSIVILAGLVTSILLTLTAIQGPLPVVLEKTTGGEEAIRTPNAVEYDRAISHDNTLILLFFLAGGCCIVIVSIGIDLWRWYRIHQYPISTSLIEDQ